MNVALRPSARPAAVDLELGSTLAATQIKVSGREHFARDGYIVVSFKPQANDAPICESATGVTVVAQAFGTGPCNYVIVGEKTLAPSGNVTAATWARTFSPVTRPSFSAVAVCTSEFWWTGNRASVGASIKVDDRRLAPFYERLARIEQGEWDSELGKRPAKTALTNARAVLNQLKGGPVAPKKLVGGDGLIAIYFTTGVKYSSVEILNNGAMLILNSDGQAPPLVERFTLAKLPSIIDKIRAHIA
jgi:hypothetical protein